MDEKNYFKLNYTGKEINNLLSNINNIFSFSVTYDNQEFYSTATFKEIYNAYQKNNYIICNYKDIDISNAWLNEIDILTSSYIVLTGKVKTFFSSYNELTIKIYSNDKIEVKINPIDRHTYIEGILDENSDDNISITTPPEYGNNIFNFVQAKFISYPNLALLISQPETNNLINLKIITADSSSFCFSTSLGFNYIICTITADNQIIYEEGELQKTTPITIGDKVWNGSEEVDFTNTINNLIDAKLGVIENGSY